MRTIVCLLLFGVGACHAQARLPNCVPPSQLVPFIKEELSGDRSKHALRDRYIEHIGNLVEVHAKLIAVSDTKPGVVICNSTSINARVIGKEHPILVNLGVVTRFGHDKELLAAVLAHELGHLDRHHFEYRNRAMGVFQYNAEAIAREEFRRTWNSQHAVRVAQGELDRKRFAFSREQEKDADSHGTVLLTRAGFRPIAMVKLMTQFAIRDDGRATEWSDTHPGGLERLVAVEPRALDEEIDQFARQLAGSGDRRTLAAQINDWLIQLPDSGNAWFHKGELLDRLRSPAFVEAYERALSRSSPPISRTNDELAEIWLRLCVALFQEGYKPESAYCSSAIRDAGVRERYRQATFGDMLFLHVGQEAATDLVTARDADGRKILTNVPSVLRARGLPTGQTIAPWRPIRFPPNEVDRPLRIR